MNNTKAIVQHDHTAVRYLADPSDLGLQLEQIPLVSENENGLMSPEQFEKLGNAQEKEAGKGLSTNDFTDELKNKVSNLEDHFKGKFGTLSELELVSGKSGDYAYCGVGEDMQEYIYNVATSKWILSVRVPSAETPVTIKQQYESNANTNAFTDAEKTALSKSVPNTRKVQGKSLTADVSFGLADLGTIGGRNYIENSNFFKGAGAWKTNTDKESVEIVQNNIFLQIARLNSSLNTQGMMHFGIGVKMEVGKIYTFSAYIRTDPAAVEKTAVINMSFQGSINQMAGTFEIDSEWKRYTITQKYTYGNNNPRFYGIGDFNIANVILEEGTVATDWNMDPDDISYIFKRVKNVEQWIKTKDPSFNTNV